MSDENLIGVDPLDWMNKEEASECKKELSGDAATAESQNETDEKKYVLLDSRFDIRSLDEFKKLFSEFVENSDHVSIDVSDVNKVDAASMQFLTAFKKTADEKLMKVGFENVNEYFLSAAKLMGVQELLELKS